MKHTIPIWISDWVVEYTGGRGIAPRFTINGVVAKGMDEKAVITSPDCLRTALRVLFDRKKKIDNDLLAKYKPISVDLVKQVGYGISEEE